MSETEQKAQKKSSKNSIFISSSAFSSTNEKSRIHKTVHTQTFHSQPKLENKRLKYCRATTNSSFFNHLYSTKAVEADELLDQSFVKFLDNVQQHKGFRGTKTHSWNQLIYLTPQKRHKNSTQQLKEIKKQLYQIIKPEKPAKYQKQEKTPVRTTLVQFLTEYNLNKDENSSNLEKIHVKRCQRKSSNIIRQKLISYQKKSEYKNKMNNYKLLFQGYKFAGS